MFKDENEFKNIVQKLNIDTKTNPAHREKLKEKMLSVFNETSQNSGTTKLVLWRIIMKSPLTKLAAAIIFAASLIYFIFPTKQPVWADIVGAINNADNIHVVMKITRFNSQIDVENFWIKNKSMFRAEQIDDGITIDDGINCLNLDVKYKEAKFIYSNSTRTDNMKAIFLKFVFLFNSETAPDLAEDLVEDYKTTELTEESTDTERVFKITFHDDWTGKVWINKKTNLPRNIIITPIKKDDQSVLSLEIIYDYQPISLEKFRFYIPKDYKFLPRLEDMDESKEVNPIK